jgi:hypothetical protein
VNQVELYPPHTGPRTEPDRPIGIWHASTPVRHNIVLDLEHPGPTWGVRRDPGHLQSRTRYGVLAGHWEDDEELTQVNFRPGQLTELRPGQVAWRAGRVIREDRVQPTGLVLRILGAGFPKRFTSA